VTYFDRNRPSPVSYQYNLDIQKLFFGNLLVETGYIANVSHHLTANDLTIDQLLPSQFGPGKTQVLRPFPQFSNVSMLNPAVGNSTYHGVFVKSERRFANGFRSSRTILTRSSSTMSRRETNLAIPAVTWINTIAGWIRGSAGRTCRIICCSPGYTKSGTSRTTKRSIFLPAAGNLG